MEGEQFILVWQGGVCSVLCGNIFLHSSEKPNLPFAFNELVCESPTGVYFRTIGNKQAMLTDAEIIACRQYCEGFIENGEYMVFAYDPNDSNLFVGEIGKKECDAAGFKWVLDTAPEMPVSSYDETSGEWIPYVAALTDEGHLIENPQTNSRNFVQYFTQRELAIFPKPNRDSDTWDFVSEQWVDRRDIERVRKEAILDLRSNYDIMRWRKSGGFVTAYEQGTWRDQLDEAKAYLSDSNAETPYIDAFLNARDDNGIPSKQELCEDILANHRNYLRAQAETSARIWHYKKLIQAASTCSEVDSIRATFTEEIDRYFKEKEDHI